MPFGVVQSWRDVETSIWSAAGRGTARPRDAARQVRRHPPVHPRRPACATQAIAAPRRPGPPEARPPGRDQVNATEAIVNPLLGSYGPWGSGAHVSYPYGRLVNNGLWHLPDRAQLLDAKGNVREGIARGRDAPAGFTPNVLAALEHRPELMEMASVSGSGRRRPRSASPPRRPTYRTNTTCQRCRRRIPSRGSFRRAVSRAGCGGAC